MIFAGLHGGSPLHGIGVVVCLVSFAFDCLLFVCTSSNEPSPSGLACKVDAQEFS